MIISFKFKGTGTIRAPTGIDVLIVVGVKMRGSFYFLGGKPQKQMSVVKARLFRGFNQYEFIFRITGKKLVKMQTRQTFET